MDTYEDFKHRQEEVISRLNAAGIEVKQGKKQPTNGFYSGLVGSRKEKLVIQIAISTHPR